MQPFCSSFLTGFLLQYVFLRVYYRSYVQKAINLWLRFSDDEFRSKLMEDLISDALCLDVRGVFR